MAAANVPSHEIIKKSVSTPEKTLETEIMIKEENAEKLEIDLSVKCRACFTEEPEMHYLYSVFDQEFTLADILMQTSSIVCNEDDGFPPYLCMGCTTCVIDFFNFKNRWQQTDIYIKALLGQNVLESPKSEDDGVNTNTESLINNNDSSDNSESINEVQYLPEVKGVTVSSSEECHLCNLDFNETSQYDTHMAKEHGKNPFIKYDLFRTLLHEHEKSIIAKKSDAKKRKRALELDLHEQLLTSMPGKLCRLCKKKYPEQEFKAHWDSHKIHVCDKCDHKCVKKSDLDVHKLSVHNNVRNFACALCNKTFKTKQLLKRHQVVHLNPRSYCCDMCGQRFNDNGTLRTHVQLKHIRTRNFICPICGLAFPIKPTLDKHILRHNKDRPASFYCDICASAFKDKSSLTRHHLVKHSGQFIKPACQFCGKTYFSSTKLKYHFEKYHSGKPVFRKKRGPKTVKEIDSSSDLSSSDSDSGSEESKTGFYKESMVQNADNFVKEEDCESEATETDNSEFE